MDVEKTIKSLEARHFVVQHFATKEEARDYLKGEIKDTTVGIGGSKTVKDMGLYDELVANGNDVAWHWVTPGDDTLKKELEAKVFISSANAIAETGEIVNIDGKGNRVASLAYGNKRVYIVAGTNKIAPDFDSAIVRARTQAAPPNIARFDKKVPCKMDGNCHDCRSPERACNALLVLWGPMWGMEKVEVVLIDEELGL